MARQPRRLAGIGATDLPDAVAFDAYVGPAREVTVDPIRGIARLHDGSTPGGLPIGGSGGSSLLVPEDVTASTYTPVLADADNKLKRISDATGVALTIPANSDVAFPIGTVLSFEQLGAGQITVGGAGGVTIRKPDGVNAKSAGQYSIFQVAKVSTDEWVLFGSLEQARTGLLLGSRQIFASSGTHTWTKPAGCVAVRVQLVGGGGGGRGPAASNSAAGGGAGGYSEKFITSGLGATETVTVGVGGTGGAVNTNGGAGGSSSFGSHCSATGGSGGQNAGGSGGVGSGGDLNGRGGSATSRLTTADNHSTAGGGSYFSGGGAAGVGDGGAGGNGIHGSGGGGGRYGAIGGTGGTGVVVVEEYY